VARTLGRIAIFILFPVMVMAIVFLGRITVGTAYRFGEWGERSVVESTLIVTEEKIERVEHIISTTDDLFFRAVDPALLEEACQRFPQAANRSSLIEAATVVDEHGDIVTLLQRHGADPARRVKLSSLITRELVPRIEYYESLGRYKHLHRSFDGEYLLLTYLTRTFEGRDYTTLLLYDTEAIVTDLLVPVLNNVGTERVANVVDDRNRVLVGGLIDGADEFIVARRFPSTLYRWRLQIAPTSAAMFSARAQAKAQRLSQVLLTPLALGVIVLGLVVLYLSVVRERRLNRLKSEFVANVSHELKTPLSLIRMFGELLLMGKVDDPDKARRYHEIILRETERLSTLVDNVLNLARIERGKSAYSFQPGHVEDAVERAVEVYQYRIDKAGVSLDYKVEDGLPRVRLDEAAITLAVVNLIDNAVKYAEGTDVIGVDVYRRNARVHLDIFDRGKGIPVGEAKRIFERFYRVDTEDTRRERGSGIGLNLVAQVVRDHGGTVTVESAPEQETRFSIRLPVLTED
jgi:two-component system, OmpR family, phosphate regulon sensor histidine kinase PhoR